MLLEFIRYQELGGRLTEEFFNTFSPEAESYIHYYTFNRITEIIPELSQGVEHAVKETIDYLDYLNKKSDFAAANLNASEGRIIKAQTAGATRVEYDTSKEFGYDSASDEITKRKHIYEICLRWLGHTGLMYRGVDYAYQW